MIEFVGTIFVAVFIVCLTVLVILATGMGVFLAYDGYKKGYLK